MPPLLCSKVLCIFKVTKSFAETTSVAGGSASNGETMGDKTGRHHGMDSRQEERPQAVFRPGVVHYIIGYNLLIILDFSGFWEALPVLFSIHHEGFSMKKQSSPNSLYEAL